MGCRLIFALAVWGVMSGTTWASLGLTPENSVIIPEITGNVRQVGIADLDHDGILDLLVCDNRTIVVYSVGRGSIIFQFHLESDPLDVEFLLADVNADSIPDLVIGQYLDYLQKPPDTVCRIDLFDGASGFAGHDSCFYTANRTTPASFGEPFPSVALSAGDYDGDGFNELRVAYHRYQTLNFFGTARFNSIGETRTYQSFPTSPLDSMPSCTDAPVLLRTEDGRTLQAVTRYEASVTAVPSSAEYSTTLRSMVDVVNGSGMAVATLEDHSSMPCVSDSTELISMYRAAEAGNLYSSDTTTSDLLIDYRAAYRCFSDGAATFDSTEHTYQLYHLDESDSLLFVREIPDLDGLACPKYLKAYPQQLFAFGRSSVYQVTPLTGSLESIGILPDVDTILWNSGTANADCFVVGVKGSKIAWHRIDEVTDVQDIPENLPDGFELGRIYPNPFNAVVTIPVTIPRSGQLSLEVFNVLGQCLYSIVDSKQEAGSRLFRWDAGKFSSGVYFVRATFEGQTRTTRAVLLK
jgi:hypothetical protein